MSVTVTVPHFKQTKFLNDIEMISRRAEKLGMGRIDMVAKGTVMAPFTRWIDGDMATYRDVFKVECTEWELTGDAVHKPVSYDGWTLVAACDHSMDSGIITHVFLTEHDQAVTELVAKDPTQHKGHNCEHCNAKRKRKKTFIVHNGSDYKWIGSTCVQDFCGCKNALQQARVFSLLFEVISDARENDYDGYSFTKKDYSYPLAEFLAEVAYIAKTTGFVSKSQSLEELIAPTWMQARDRLCDGKKMADDESWEFVDECICETLEDTRDTSYINNLKAYMKLESVPHRALAYVASAIGTHINRKQDESVAGCENSEYLGQEGGKLTKIDVEVIKVVSGYWTTVGYNTEVFKGVYLLKDKAGNVMKWSTGKSFEVGDKFHITSTKIKGLQEYNGIKQTVITNARIKD